MCMKPYVQFPEPHKTMHSSAYSSPITRDGRVGESEAEGQPQLVQGQPMLCSRSLKRINQSQHTTSQRLFLFTIIYYVMK